MITKIKTVKNLGIFSDFSWDKNLGDFKRYNLIYGWNGCGKTTLSKLFLALEAGGLDDYKDLEYEIETDQASFKQGKAFTQKVRVFNEDYILNNIQIVTSKAKPIYILGEENKKIIDQINADEEQLRVKQKELEEATQAKSDEIEKRGKKFTDIASTISLNTGGILSRTYRKPDAEESFKNLKVKEELNTEQIETCSLVLKQQEKPKLTLLNIGNLSQELDDLIKKGNILLPQTVKSLVIERLKNNSDISNWVENGILLHDKHKSKKCEFCTQPLTDERIKELADHFNEDDKKLKENIDQIVISLEQIYTFLEDINIIDKANLYEDLQKEYKIAEGDFKTESNALLKIISESIDYLKDKKNKTTEYVKPQGIIEVTQLVKEIKRINDILSKHNTKTVNFKSERDAAREKLEKHYLSTIYDEIKGSEEQVTKYEESIIQLNDGDPKNPEYLSITALKARINENKSKTSSSHKACSEINENLRAFLGTDEIIFEVDEEGYTIKRLGELATDLSEGEKTTIAFVYFLIHLTDQNFNLKKGIVVIDDPISSLDSNILFRVSSFVEQKLRGAEQLFVLTHNYDFFNQIKKWFLNSLNVDSDVLKHLGGFYMIKNYLDSARHKRCAEISELDPLLRDYESEYHYLFSKLYFYNRDTTKDDKGKIASIYHYPNLARKFMECFLSFRVPKRASFYVRFISLREFSTEISGTDLSEAYNFINSHSHLDTKSGLLQFDPTLTLNGEKCIELVLKLVKLADEKHFKYMEKALSV